MNILIIDNNSAHTDSLVNFVNSEGYAHQVLHWDDPDLLQKYKDFDVTILSGGAGLAVADHREDLAQEIQIVQTTSKPLIGICLGFEIISDAYGAVMEKREEKTRGLVNVDVIESNPIFLGKKNFQAFVSHKWHVKSIPDPFIVLAKTGETIEAIKHKTKPIYGFQFHPEVVMEGNQGTEVLRALLAEFKSEIKEKVLG